VKRKAKCQHGRTLAQGCSDCAGYADDLRGRLRCLAGLHPNLNDNARKLLNDAADALPSHKPEGER
jgi:hypothetical protein